jgi:predicted phosphodiesterase
MHRSPCSLSARTRLALVLFLAFPALAHSQELRLPNKGDSVKFAVMGDTGTNSTPQYEVGKQMAAYHTTFHFDFVLMCGDNLYGGSSANDYRTKFEQPYADLLSANVKFYAVLGNHDNPTEVNYKNWNMAGQRFYTWREISGGFAKVGGTGVRFFALDSNYMDKVQLDWLEAELKGSGSEWKIAFFHHPLYSSGKTHGSSLDLRALLEPLFINYGVSVVFSGHDHFYERIKPQNGIAYFVSGAGGSLRKGNINRNTGLTEVGFDTDFSFMLVEIDGLDFNFQAISRTGKTVDSGVIQHLPFPEQAGRATPIPPSADSTKVETAPVSPTPPVGNPDQPDRR